MGQLLPIVNEELRTMEEDEISDLQLIYHVRDALLEVTGGRENYDELVGCLQPKRNLTSHEAAQLVTILKALAGVVSYIDSVHHGALIFALERTSLWNLATSYKNYDATDIMDALIELLVSLAASKGMYIDWCLERLVRHFTAPKHVVDFLKNENGVDRKNKVLSRVHDALKQIADLVPLAPMRLSPIVVQNIPRRYDVTEQEIVMYVENMLKLESGAIGEIIGSTMLPALVDKLIELDVEIGLDGQMHEDVKCIFEMELEDFIEFADDDEEYNSMCASELLNRKNLQGNMVVEKLDSLIVLTFLHLESCQSSGRLSEVFDILLASFMRTVLNTYKSKFTQFVMFYACALDPELCGVKFAIALRDMFESPVSPPITRMSAVAYLASYLSRAKFLSSALVADIIQRLVDWCFAYCKIHDLDMNPQAHQVFYSGCQAIMYILCFRMKSLMDVPRLRMQLIKMPMLLLWKHKLNALKVCLPSVVEEFLKQAKAARLFMSAELFVFEDLLEADLSKAFGGIERLDMFFPFDPCLLKKSESYLRPHFVRWSRVRTTYGDEEEEDSDSGSEASDDEFVDLNAKDMVDDDMIGSVGAGLEFDPDLNKMSITPKPFKYGFKELMERGHKDGVES
ncbi:RNA polymerase I-specific transcription initiation factor rrn3-like [Vicia villosa]|uniref:RNA polymerase I-specific transcription initiation factor rrn3-like n=1 Tax=Vicia villosa TaxID=3911 RepID=UPI00273B734F|nr:RNA polymerase I-specific transcription initiation factor rrn3-like [Vicia villosa]